MILFNKKDCKTECNPCIEIKFRNQSDTVNYHDIILVSLMDNSKVLSITQASKDMYTKTTYFVMSDIENFNIVYFNNDDDSDDVLADFIIDLFSMIKDKKEKNEN